MSINKKIFVGAFIAVFAFVAAETNAAYMHSVTLKQGSSGAQVMALQQALNATSCKVAASGAGSSGMETMNFGSLTKAAVMCYQAANGLGADGVVGPMTGAKLGMIVSGPAGNPNQPGCPAGAMFNSMTGAPCTGNNNNGGGSLSGTDGTIEEVTELTQYSDEEVGEGEEDVKIAGFEVTTSNDGDVRLRSIRLEFDPSGNGTGDSDKLEDYISGVKVWMGDDEVGSADVDDFSESGDIYTRTISLSGATIDSDDEVEFFISVDGATNLDSGDIDSDAWQVDVLNIRYEDGAGVVTTFDDAPLDDMDVEFDLVDFSTAADTELKVSTASDSPDAQVVIVDEDDGEDDVVLLKGKIKLEGDSDVNIDEIPFRVTTTGDVLNDIVSNFTLILDGEEYSENVPASATSVATVTFDDLDFDLSAGDTVNFEIRADINGTDDFTAGSTVTVSLPSSAVDSIEAENEEGDDLSTSEMSGSATGEAQEFRSNGITVSLVSTDTDVAEGNSTSDDLGTFKIKFKVAANGDDIYVSSLASAAVTYVVDRAGTATTGGVSATLTNITDDDKTTVGNYLVEDGQEETFELVVTAQLPTAGAAGQFRLTLTGVAWDTSDDTSPANTYTSNLDSFKTSYLALN